MVSRPPLLPFGYFAADSPDLPVRREGDCSGPDFVVRAEVFGQLNQGVALTGTTQTGESVAITVSLVSEGIARVLLQPAGAEPGQDSLTRKDLDDAVSVTVGEKEGSVMIFSESLRVRIDLEPFQMAFFDAQGRMLLEQNATEKDATDRLTVLPFGFSRVDAKLAAFHDSFLVEPDEHFYGFGEKFTELDKRGQRLEMWHYDAYGVHGERAHKNVPFFVSTRGYGVFVDSTSCVHFDMGQSNHATFSVIVPDEALDYYVIAGPQLKTVVSRYGHLVGRPTLPPKWAFGLWVSGSFQPETQDAVLERARRLRAEGVPCDVLHLDCYWQRFGSWSDMIWDSQAFPDPEAMIRELKAMGFKICLWMNPYIGEKSERFAEARDKRYLLKTAQGEVCVSKLWGDFHPAVGIVDMTHPDAVEWFQGLLRPLLRMGVDLFKTDFGEGVPADAVSHAGMRGDKLHNLYPLLYNDAVAAVTAEETGRSGLVWARSSHAGGQRHAAQWAGDPNCTYQALAATLRGGLSLGMCGHAFWSHDMGGFHGTPTAELFVRWSQFGLLSPLSRAHGRTSRLPWDFGSEALRLFREYARLRYRLLPYIYSSAVKAADQGLPMMRAMVLEFPDDPNTYHLDLQYMLGEDLLVAPVYNPTGERPVYFPAGQWVTCWTRQVIEGPATRVESAAMDYLPLFVRADTLIPIQEPGDHLSDTPFDLVTFEAYLLDEGRIELHDTDGITIVSAVRQGTCLAIQAEGVKSRFGFRLLALPDTSPIDHVEFNGKTLSKVGEFQIRPEAPPGWTTERDGTIRAMLECR